jgi:hypothetical protein
VPIKEAEPTPQLIEEVVAESAEPDENAAVEQPTTVAQIATVEQSIVVEEPTIIPEITPQSDDILSNLMRVLIVIGVVLIIVVVVCTAVILRAIKRA